MFSRKSRQSTLSMQKIIPLFCLVLTLAGCAATSIPSATLANADYGPLPQNYETNIKSFLSQSLRDPYSAVIQLSDPQQIWVELDNNKFWFGYAIVASVNAKNGFGAYTGDEYYVFRYRSDTNNMSPLDLNFKNKLWGFVDQVRRTD